jgi:hypothetical protein
MSSYESIMFQLTSGFISETSVPTDYLKYPEIIRAIQTHKWQVGSTMQGWTQLVKIVNYSN